MPLVKIKGNSVEFPYTKKGLKSAKKMAKKNKTKVNYAKKDKKASKKTRKVKDLY